MQKGSPLKVSWTSIVYIYLPHFATTLSEMVLKIPRKVPVHEIRVQINMNLNPKCISQARLGGRIYQNETLLSGHACNNFERICKRV